MKSKVFFTTKINSESILQVFEKLELNPKRFAIKLHFGEEGNTNFLNPDLIKPLAIKYNADLIEANVLYVSKRRYTKSHIELAKKHGFDFSPIKITDKEKEIIINKKHFKSVFVSSVIDDYDSILSYSHFKGHMMGGFGGALKNLGMGLGSVHGKMQMHASAIPTYDASKCTNCGTCVKKCPGDAITLEPVKINESKCIGCGTCIGVCPVRLYNIPWGSSSPDVVQERFVEYAYGITKEKKVVYVNVLANISPYCDCMSDGGKPFTKDIGVLASNDIVAIERASLDFVNKACQCADAFLKNSGTSGNRQIDYSKELEMGTDDYELVEI